MQYADLHLILMRIYCKRIIANKKRRQANIVNQYSETLFWNFQPLASQINLTLSRQVNSFSIICAATATPPPPTRMQTKNRLLFDCVCVFVFSLLKVLLNCSGSLCFFSASLFRVFSHLVYLGQKSHGSCQNLSGKGPLFFSHSSHLLLKLLCIFFFNFMTFSDKWANKHNRLPKHFTNTLDNNLCSLPQELTLGFF